MFFYILWTVQRVMFKKIAGDASLFDDETVIVLDDLRKRLLYRSSHRGMKEMDVLLGGYATDFLQNMTSDELQAFGQLLDENDNDLLNWILEREPVPEDHSNPVLTKIIDYKKTL